MPSTASSCAQYGENDAVSVWVKMGVGNTSVLCQLPETVSYHASPFKKQRARVYCTIPPMHCIAA